MGSNHRKLLQIPQNNSYRGGFCNGVDTSYNSSPPPPQPPPTPRQYLDVVKSETNLPISPIFILLFCFLASILVLICCLTLLRKYHLNLNNRRRRISLDLDQNEDFIDEDRGPEFVHPIWYINSAGLRQSVINSMAIFKYKRDDGLTEGTECSVCLSEFEEDESLRLLPKCSHAFHIPCIDTWLRSHKNCPMCRAPVVLGTNIAHLSAAHQNLNGLSSREENSPDNRNGELRSQQAGEYRGETSESRIGGENENASALALPIEQENFNEIFDKNTPTCVNPRDGRVPSDLADHIDEKPVEDLQPVRRSISVDSISDSMIHFAVSNIRPMEQQVSSKKLDTKKVARQGNKSNSRKYGVMKSSSFGRSVHKGSGSIKRSFSTSAKCSRPRSSRSQDSILPL